MGKTDHSSVTVLSNRIHEFRCDPDNVRQMNEFIDQLLKDAVKEVENIKRDRMVKPEPETVEQRTIRTRLNAARGFVVRMFDAFCNCTQNAAEAARTTARNNPFAKRF